MPLQFLFASLTGLSEVEEVMFGLRFRLSVGS